MNGEADNNAGVPTRMTSTLEADLRSAVTTHGERSFVHIRRLRDAWFARNAGLIDWDDAFLSPLVMGHAFRLTDAGEREVALLKADATEGAPA